MSPSPTSLLAFVTTVHLGLVVLRKHRMPAGARPWALLPSVLLCISPWLFPFLTTIAVGLALHAGWFVACETLIPGVRPAEPAQAPPARPVASVEARALMARPDAPAASASRDFVPVAVLAIIEESPAIRTFRLARPASFAFVAGQFLTVRVLVDGQPHVRCYSISSSPECPGYLEISVKRQGLVSGTLHATLRPGSQLFVRAPAGRFTYPAGDDRPIVLLAGGVGITPLISMLRHAVAAEPGRPVTLLYSAKSGRELAFFDELEWLARRHPHIRLVCTVTEPDGGWQDRVGRIDAAFVANYVPNAAHSVFLLCGPASMIDGLRAALQAMGVPAAQIRSEVFQASAAIGARPPAAAGEAAGHEPDAPDAGTRRLALTRSGRTVEVAGDQTLLDAAESAGAAIPTLCRAGVCGTCRTRLLSGEVQCTSDALDDRDRKAGFVLPCVTWARGDCALEA
jgi:ferredoxin-NADP reductase